MTKYDMVQRAIQDLGDVPAADLAAYVERNFAERIEPPLVLLIRATLLHKELLVKYREEARAIVERAKAT